MLRQDCAVIYTIGHTEAYLPAFIAGAKIIRRAGSRAFPREEVAWEWLMENHLEGWSVWSMEGSPQDMDFDEETMSWRLNRDLEVIG